MKVGNLTSPWTMDSFSDYSLVIRSLVTYCLDPKVISETGGLSGPILKPLALKSLRTLYEYTGGKVPLVGCGGIATAQDALDYAKNGASIIQVG